jgi:hypothetical protein
VQHCLEKNERHAKPRLTSTLAFEHQLAIKDGGTRIHYTRITVTRLDNPVLKVTAGS